MQTIYSGDTYGVQVTMQTNGVAVNIDTSTTVTAGIVNRCGDLVAGPWSIVHTTPGSDWTTGVIIIPLDGDETAAYFTETPGFTDTSTICTFEIQTVLSGQTTTRRTEEFKLVKQGI